MADLLTSFGWDSAREAEFAPHRAQGLEPARVCLEHNHILRVTGASGEFLAEAAGRFKHQAAGRNELPAVGDWVAVRPGAPGDRAVILAILPRRSWFSRRAAGRGTEEQIIAANVDVVLLVFGLDRPVNARAIERYVLVAKQSRATPVVVLNKADLVDDPAEAVADATALVGDTPVVAVSSRTGASMARLAEWLSPGRTLALLGPSGAGKSSLVNVLVGHALLPIGEVRDWDARGRHTSVHRQLVLREAGGLIIDTPGMRELQLWEDAPAADAFADVETLGAACRFRDCRHATEPGCAVRAAAESGALDADRYASFLKLQTEQETIAKRRDERLLIDAKRQSKVIQKALRAMQKDRGR